MTSGNTVRLDFHSSLEHARFRAGGQRPHRRMAGLDDESRSLGERRRARVGHQRHQARQLHDARKRVHVEFTPLAGRRRAGHRHPRPRRRAAASIPSALADPLAPENLLKSSGRGIFLMRSFMDEMTFQRAPQGGMEVRMVKRDSPVRRVA